MNARQPPGAAWDELARAYQARMMIAATSMHLGPNGASADDLGLLSGMDSGARVLDIGCGGGQNAIFLAKRGSIVTGVDPSSAQLEAANHLAQTEGVGVEWCCATVENLPEWLLPQRREYYDFAYAIFSLEYVADLLGALRSIVDLLRPGGRFVYCDLHPAVSWTDISDPGHGGLSGYHCEESIPFEWRNTAPGVVMVRHHRTLSTICNSFIEAQLSITSLAEPEIDTALVDAVYRDPDISQVVELLAGHPYTLVVAGEKAAKNSGGEWFL